MIMYNFLLVQRDQIRVLGIDYIPAKIFSNYIITNLVKKNQPN
jgi:hypothetical protein